MNYRVLLDKYSWLRCHVLLPEMNIFGLESLGQASDAINLTKPVAQTISNWLETPEIVDSQKVVTMAQYSV